MKTHLTIYVNRDRLASMVSVLKYGFEILLKAIFTLCDIIMFQLSIRNSKRTKKSWEKKNSQN